MNGQDTSQLIVWHSALPRRCFIPCGGKLMISMPVVKQTALTLMDKAAIEIPDDYLSGLEKAAS